jgi:hypothetical protein
LGRATGGLLCGLGFLGGLGCFLGAAGGLFGRRAARFFLSGLAGLLGSAARFFGGGEDGDLLLLAPLGLALGGFLLLFCQDALADGDLGCGQAARRGSGAWRRRAGRRALCRRRSDDHRGWRWRHDGGTLFANLDLNDLGPAMAEALPDGSGIDGATDLCPSCRAQ